MRDGGKEQSKVKRRNEEREREREEKQHKVKKAKRVCCNIFNDI